MKKLYTKQFLFGEYYHGCYSERITLQLFSHIIWWERFEDDHKAWGRTYGERDFKIHGWRFRGVISAK